MPGFNPNNEDLELHCPCPRRLGNACDQGRTGPEASLCLSGPSGLSADTCRWGGSMAPQLQTSPCVELCVDSWGSESAWASAR